MVRSPKLIIGNWKMNGHRHDGIACVQTLMHQLSHKHSWPFEMVICPPVLLIWPIAECITRSPLILGGQDCHAQKRGAFTGDIAASMLAEAGCRYVLIGHSERRRDHYESDDLIAAKIVTAIDAGLTVILCVGETEIQRREGQAFDVIEQQICSAIPQDFLSDMIVVAYEPIWAIGSGQVARSQDISTMHHHIASVLVGQCKRYADRHNGHRYRILYGGSVTRENAAPILALPEVDGVLVGNASMNPEEFWQIATSVPLHTPSHVPVISYEVS